MKQLFAILLVLILGYSVQVQAALELRGVGTSAHGTYQLIYDTDFNITWYDYTNTFSTSWQDQMDWASALSVTFGSTTYTDWRLPTALNQNVTGPCEGINCAGSEMGHLYYSELGNVDDRNTYNGLSNTGDFQNLQASNYWSGTERPIFYNYAWSFGMNSGDQGVSYKGNHFLAIAVRDGDITVVPEPISSILFVAGGTLLAGRRLLKRKV